MKKFSIIVPVYNVENYLEKCLNSLVNQKHNNYEIVIVNDGSTDNGQKIIDEYKKKYPKLISSYKKANGGLSSARNYGIEKCNGEYLLFVDSDDYICDDCLEILDSNLKKYNSDIIVFNFYLDNDNYIEKKNTYFNNIDDNIKKYITANPSACNKLIKKDLFIKNYIKFMENVYYEDLATMPLFALHAKNITFIGDALYYYVVRNESIMNKKSFNTKMNDIFKVLNSNYKYLNEKYSEELEYLYIEHLLRNASLRFLDYNKTDKVDEINKIISEKFKNWRKNNYYKNNYNIKQKIICNLIYKGKYQLVQRLRKK